MSRAQQSQRPWVRRARMLTSRRTGLNCRKSSSCTSVLALLLSPRLTNPRLGESMLDVVTSRSCSGGKGVPVSFLAPADIRMNAIRICHHPKYGSFCTAFFYRNRDCQLRRGDPGRKARPLVLAEALNRGASYKEEHAVSIRSTTCIPRASVSCATAAVRSVRPR